MKKSALGIITATLFTLSLPVIAAEQGDQGQASGDDQTSQAAGGEQKAPAEHTSMQVIEFLSR